MRRGIVLAFLAVILAFAGPAAAQAPATLELGGGASVKRLTAAELSARPDVRTVTVRDDIYAGAVTYRAVPLLPLLDAADPGFDTVEVRANDGFVSQIPLDLIRRGDSGGAVALIAIEDPTHPWPPLPHGNGTAGPFYLIWEHPERSAVSSEQWPYQVAGLALTESPAHRWPQLSAPRGTTDPIVRHGQEVFVTQCLACHRLNGGGAAEVGPDLGQPMNATRYLSDAGIRAIVRDPRAVRTWPGQIMTGFTASQIADGDIDAIIAYLHAIADKPGAAH